MHLLKLRKSFGVENFLFLKGGRLGTASFNFVLCTAEVLPVLVSKILFLGETIAPQPPLRHHRLSALHRTIFSRQNSETGTIAGIQQSSHR